jgi:cysteine desulfurase
LEVLAERGVIDLQLVPVDAGGVIDPATVAAMLRPETCLLAVMAVNNETGAVQPVLEIAATVKALNASVHVHVDSVQAIGKMDCSWIGQARTIDSVALSGHKIGAFKGCGALFLRAGTKLQGLLFGGGQERARRPGTENVPGILSFGLRARELMANDGAEWKQRVSLQKEMQLRLLAGLAAIPGAVVHGDPARSVANTVNFHIDGVAGDDLLLNLDLARVAASSGSACSSGVGRPSHVLKAMGHSDWIALNSVRLSFGRPSGPALAGVNSDVERIVQIVRQTVERVRGGAPDKGPS